MKYFAPIIMTVSLLYAEPLTVEQLFNVKTVAVKEERAGSQQRFFGYVTADESRRHDVAPRFGGFVETLYADRTYMKVRKGDVLAKLYSPEVYRAKEEYRATVRYHAQTKDEAMLRSAREKLELLGVPADEIEAAAGETADLHHTSLKAPVTGIIFIKNLNTGSAFNARAKLFEIVDLSSVWVEARVGETDIPKLGNLRFSVKTESLDAPLAATAPVLYPSIAPKESLATLRLNVKNPGGKLFPGMYAAVTAAAPESVTLTLPKTAVVRKNGTWYAFAVGEYEGEYEPVEVTVKPLDSGRYAVLSGLEAGQEVVDNALFMMDSDAQINGLY